MRAITVLCTIVVALFASMAGAFAGCTEVPAPAINKRINDRVPGYEPVRVVFTADRTDASSLTDKAGKEKFRFWIEGHVTVLFDREKWIMQVRHCTLGAGRTAPKELKTFVDMHYRPVKTEGENDLSGEIPMLIPAAVAASQPRVGITYDSGTELRGKWEKITDKGVSYSQLVIGPAE
jgi:hypothetical protein